jgi:hypothetical protein
MKTARTQTARPPSGNGKHEASADLTPLSVGNAQGSPVHQLQQHLVTRLSEGQVLAPRSLGIDFRGGALVVLAAALAGVLLAGAQFASGSVSPGVSRPSVQTAGAGPLSERAEATQADTHSPLPV